MPSLMGVELARVGTWNLSTGGRRTFTAEDFADAIAAAGDPDFGDPGIWPGHVDPRFDGEPSLGRVANMRMVGDRLVSDFVDLPGWLTERIRAAYPGRSIEGFVNVLSPSGRTYRLVVSGVALLGVTPPAMRGLRDLPAAIAAGAQPIAASSAEMDLGAMPVEPEPTSATPAAGETNVSPSRTESRQGVALDPIELRRSMGLAEDASDADVLARAAELAARPEASSQPTPETPPAATPTPAATESGPTPQATEPAPEVLVSPTAPAAASPPGTVVVDAVQWAEVQRQAAEGAAVAASMRRAERDRFIGEVVAAGRLTRANADLRSSLEREWDRDPEGARRIAASLAVVVPTSPIGHEVAPDLSDDDAVLASLWPTEGA